MTTVAVAPREIHDLVYRCCRVAGCDPGLADRVADNVMYAEVLIGGGVAAFVATAGADEPNSAFAQAADRVESAEAGLRSGGDGRAEFDEPVPLAAIAGAIWHLLGRPMSCTPALSSDASALCAAVEIVDGKAEEAQLQPLRDRVAGCMRNGVAVPTAAFEVLEVRATAFLVAEATLDELV